MCSPFLSFFTETITLMKTDTQKRVGQLHPGSLIVLLMCKLFSSQRERLRLSGNLQGVVCSNPSPYVWVILNSPNLHDLKEVTFVVLN